MHLTSQPILLAIAMDIYPRDKGHGHENLPSKQYVYTRSNTESQINNIREAMLNLTRMIKMTLVRAND